MRRRPPPPGSVELPARLRSFVAADWPAGDDPPPPPGQGDDFHARSRWFDARRRWCEAVGTTELDLLIEQRRARRARMAADYAARNEDGRSDD